MNSSTPAPSKTNRFGQVSFLRSPSTTAYQYENESIYTVLGEAPILLIILSSPDFVEKCISG